ncbi:MAG: metallophosphoesterase, partial [Bacteroidales bacterium]|nr:metallophosphoesterase [Bacteroidales bacterium]
LLNKLQITSEDTLYFLGDYIDRGPDSSEVLDIIIQLKKEFPKVTPLSGNHEYQMLQAEKEYNEKAFYYYVKKLNNSTSILNKKKKLRKKYRKFMKSLPYYIELEDYFLVHAGFDFKKENPFDDINSLLNIRNFKYNMEKAKGKSIIIGHSPTYFHQILKQIKKNKKIIKLDNGCVYTKPHKIYDYKQLGKLCCFNLDTKELICQKNIDV